jgi:hypothetical protein
MAQGFADVGMCAFWNRTFQETLATISSRPMHGMTEKGWGLVNLPYSLGFEVKLSNKPRKQGGSRNEFHGAGKVT